MSDCKQSQMSRMSYIDEANQNPIKLENQTENQESNQNSKTATKWISKLSLGLSISITLVMALATFLIAVTRKNSNVRIMILKVIRVILDVIPLCLIICPDQTFEFTSRKVEAFFERNM